jgi:hypothetical protein
LVDGAAAISRFFLLFVPRTRFSLLFIPLRIHGFSVLPLPSHHLVTDRVAALNDLRSLFVIGYERHSDLS